MANLDLDKYCGSEFWNYSRLWQTDDPDFTICFEKTVFVWTPCVFLLVFSVPEFYFIVKSKSRDIPWNLLNITKQICTTILIAFSIADLANAQHRRNQGENVPDVDIYTPVIRMLFFLYCSFLTILNQWRGLRTSGVLTIFWILSFIFGIPQYRTEIRRELYEVPYKDRHKYPFVSYMVYLPLVAVMLILNCLADKAPRNSQHPKTLRLCPESSSSFINKIYFSWFNRMAWTGSRRPLEPNDLWTLRPEDQNSEVFPAFYNHYERELEYESDSSSNNGNKAKTRDGSSKKKGKKRYTTRTVSVLPALFKAFGGSFLIGSFFNLLQDILTFVSPFVLRMIIGYVQGNEPSWKGILYAFTFLITGLLQSVFSTQASFRSFVAGMRIRSALIGALFRKALRITSRSRKDSTVGSIVNLMSVDAHRFLELMQYLNSVWSAPLQIALALYFLWGYLGVAVLAGLASLILLMPISGFILNKEQSLQVQQLKCKDDRLKFMNEILGGMKVLKLYAWEQSFEEKIAETRSNEAAFMRKEVFVHSATYFTWGIAPFIITLFSFATFILIDKNNILDAETTFVCLALFNTLRTPLFMLPMTLAHLARAYVSIKRIDSFMNSEDLDPSSISHDADEEPALLIENGSFSWGPDEEPTLKEINLSLPQGSVVAVVGTVGSGKSSLVSAFLGEMDKVKGRVNILGSVAYVQQQAWIQTATLRDNVLFGTSYKSGPYDRVIEACALKSDLEILPGGDQTEIGEKGINLSGGQRQRVALARAVYKAADVYLLDDPLSAVDSHVGKHIFENVIGPKGVLRGKTRLLVTHSVTFLPDVDLIVVLKGGEVSEIGTYKQLIERKGAFAEYLAQHTQGGEEAAEEPQDAAIQELPRRVSRDSHHSDTVSQEEYGSLMRRESDVLRRRSSVAPPKEVIGQRLIQEELAETGNVKLDVYMHYVRSIGVVFAVGTILCNTINQVVYVGGSVWLSVWSTDQTMLNVNSTDFFPKRDMYLGVYAAIGLGQGLTTVLSGGVPRMGCVRAAVLLHVHLLRAVMRAPLSFFDTTPTGRLLARFGRDMEVLDNVLPLNIPALWWCLFEIIATLVVISYTTPEFIGVLIPIAAFYYFVQRFYVSTTRQLKRLESISRAHIYTHFSESITGAVSIRAFRAVNRFVDESDKRVDVNQSSYFPSVVANHWLIIRLELVGNLIIFFAALFAVLQQGAQAGIIALSVTYSLQITSFLKWLVQMSSEVEANIVAVERILEYVDTPPEAAWENPSVAVHPSWPDEGKVRFKKYETRYRPGLDLVLRGIDFTVKGGEKVGIVGRTGAGKSSLTLALFRIIEAAGGRIKIDGVDISNLGLHALRSRLTIIPQDPVLFSGTLRHNIDPFQVFKDEEVWRALEHANLKAFVKGLGDGLSHQVSEGGENLSVGQRQLVCLARALLRKSKILILDEATAAVDLDTDDFIQRKIREEFKECTVLTIAHRLNTIMDSNRVMVLDQGKIAEFDSPAALLENHASIFYSMAKDAGLV